MGDYTIDYLSDSEKQRLDTILKPYGLKILNITEPTRTRKKSRTLIDYLITDHSCTKSFETIVSDSPFRKIRYIPIDHLATSAVTNIQIKGPVKVSQKIFSDKSKYNKDHFCQIVEDSNWRCSYNQKSAESIFKIFTDIIQSALKKSSQKKRSLSAMTRIG